MSRGDRQSSKAIGGEERKPSIISETQSLTNRYGKFFAHPFEPGFGTTIGNCLRRALLSSIEGAAITAVKIEGALHEFASIPGVVEDATDIILNLKRIPFKLHGAGLKTLRVERKVSGELLSGEIEFDADVEILDPNVHIATILEGGSLSIEMRIKCARGYISAERNFDEDLAVGFIPIDSVHSPIKKVYYTVESVRLGQNTDYDKLTIEVWTNGCVKPDSAIGLAAKYIKDYLQIFIDLGEVPEQVETEEVKKAPALNKLNNSIDELPLSVETYNNLKNANIRTLRELVQKSEAEILQIETIDVESFIEIEAFLTSIGLHLGMLLDEQSRLDFYKLNNPTFFEDDVVPWFFRGENETALRLQVEWVRERLNLDDYFFSRLLKIRVIEFQDWRINYINLSLPQEKLNILKDFWQMILHLLSYLSFNPDLVQTMLNKTNEREKESVRSPFDPPWVGTSIKEYLETSEPLGISEVTRWVLSFRFADRHQFDTTNMTCP